MINMILRGFAQCDDYISEVSCDRSDVIISYLFKMINMIRSVVHRQPLTDHPPPIVQRLPNDDQASQGRHISHVNCGTYDYELMMLLRSVIVYLFIFPLFASIDVLR